VLNENVTPPRATAIIKPEEISQAIGRGGVNIRLAGELTGYEIDVYRDIPEDEEDIEIEEFSDEFSEDTIKRLKDIGCDTARAVMQLSVDELQRRAGFERETAQRILDVVKSEFEELEEGQ